MDREPIKLKDFDQFMLVMMFSNRCERTYEEGLYRLTHQAARAGLGLNYSKHWNSLFTGWMDLAESRIEWEQA